MACKIAAAALLLVLVGGAALAGAGTVLAWSGGGTAESYVEDDLCPIGGGLSYALCAATEPERAAFYLQRLEDEYQGLLMSVYEGDPETGTLLATNIDPDVSYDLLPGQRVMRWDNEGGTYYTAVGQLISPLPRDGLLGLFQVVYDAIHTLGGLLPLLTVALALGALADLGFLLSAAGRRRGVEGIVAGWQEKIPLELYLTGAGLLEFALLLVLIAPPTTIQFNQASEVARGAVLVVWMVCVAAIMLLVLTAALMSLAVRVKLGKWWRGSLCYLLFRWVRRLWRRCLEAVRTFFRFLPMTWRSVLLVGGALFVQLCLTLMTFVSYRHNGFFFLLLLVIDGCIVVGAAWLTVQAQRIRDEGEALAEGDLEAKVDTQGMYWDLKTHAENLNAIGQGLNRAVEQRMRSERLKTELITNVSHDIKTPLTSIVNYVDLLKKEELPETAQEYLAVLDRQSRRLKKLTEDLVEASKASTGNVAVHLEPIVVNEIVHQAIGDYSEKLTAGKLEVIVNTYEGNLEAVADGRLLWRVLDNLLGNVCKYALAGTRVYVDLGTQNGRVSLSVKNISRDPLNVKAEDLMERFVRGDASRHTEGSGLGLNIAQSLMDLMGGTFAISVDGDLFKAQLTLPATGGLPPAPEEAPPALQPAAEAEETSSALRKLGTLVRRGRARARRPRREPEDMTKTG